MQPKLMLGRVFALTLAVSLLSGCSTSSSSPDVSPTPSTSVSPSVGEVEIPDVSGLKEAQAVQVLESLGLVAEIVRGYYWRTPKGYVDGVVSGIGDRVPKGSRVVIAVSKGEDPQYASGNSSDSSQNNDGGESQNSQSQGGGQASTALTLTLVSGNCKPVLDTGKTVCSATFKVENVSELPFSKSLKGFLTVSSKVYRPEWANSLQIDINPSETQVVNTVFTVPSGLKLENFFIGEGPNIGDAVALVDLNGTT